MKKAGAVSLLLLFVLVAYAFAKNIVYFSDTIPRYYRWVSPKSFTLKSDEYIVWINAPEGFQLMLVNEDTGDYYAIVTPGGYYEEKMEVAKGKYSIMVESSDTSGTFRCGVKK